MADSTLGFDIVKMVEDLSVEDGGSKLEAVKSVAKVLGAIVPVEGLEDFADSLAQSFGLKQKSDSVQTGIYILTKVVILSI